MRERTAAIEEAVRRDREEHNAAASRAAVELSRQRDELARLRAELRQAQSAAQRDAERLRADAQRQREADAAALAASQRALADAEQQGRRQLMTARQDAALQRVAIERQLRAQTEEARKQAYLAREAEDKHRRLVTRLQQLMARLRGGASLPDVMGCTPEEHVTHVVTWVCARVCLAVILWRQSDFHVYACVHRRSARKTRCHSLTAPLPSKMRPARPVPARPHQAAAEAAAAAS